jgi:hypothetical protein
MAVGASHWWVAGAGTAVAGAAAVIVRPKAARDNGRRGGALAESLLTVRVGLGRDPDAMLRDVFAKYLSSFDLHSCASARQGTVLDLAYRVQLQPGTAPVEFVNAVHRIDAVVGVELTSASEKV